LRLEETGACWHKR